MRIAVAVLCVLALTAPASARFVGHDGELPCDVTLPADLKEPTVQYSIRVVPQGKLFAACTRGVAVDVDASRILACTFRKSANFWPIYISASVPPDQVGCLIAYEKAHMPPNYWAEPEVELPKTIEWLNQQKGALH